MPRLPTAFRTTPKPTEQRKNAVDRRQYRRRRWEDVREWIGSEANWMCVACGAVTGKSGHCDHIRPAGTPGVEFHDTGNLQWLCKSCHSAKTRNEQNGRTVGSLRKRMIYVVTGKPASGKTTWVRQHAKPGDLVWDTDAVAAAVFGMPNYPRPPQIAESLAFMRGAALRCIKDISGDVYVIETERAQAERIAATIGATLQVVECDEDTRQQRLSQRMESNG